MCPPVCPRSRRLSVVVATGIFVSSSLPFADETIMIPCRPAPAIAAPAYPTQRELVADAREHARALALVAAAALVMGGCTSSTPQQPLAGTPPPAQAPAQPQAPLSGEATTAAPPRPLAGKPATVAPVAPPERLAGDVMPPKPVQPLAPLGGAPPPPR